MAGAETDHGVCCSRSVLDDVGVGEDVARPDPGDRPELGEAADDDQPRRVARGQDCRSTGTSSMNASSTTTSRPGLAEARIVAAGWSTPVGLVGLPIITRSASSGTSPGRGAKPSVGVRTTCSGTVAGGAQRDLRLGELRVHDDRAPPVAEPGDQGEGLGGAGGREHVLAARGRAAGRRLRSRLASRRGRRRRRSTAATSARSSQRWARAVVHVDGEVDEAGAASTSPWCAAGPEWSWCRVRRRGPVSVAGSRGVDGVGEALRRAGGGRPSGCGGRRRAGVGVAKPSGLGERATRVAAVDARRRSGAVELVAGDRARPAAPAGCRSGQPPVAVGQRQPGRHRGRRRRARRPSGRSVDRPAQVEQPAHSATVGSPAGDRGARCRARSARVGGQLGGVHLGEAAAEVEPGGARRQRRRRSAGRTDDRLAAGGAQQLVGLGVAEGERPAAGDRDHPPCRCRSGGESVRACAGDRLRRAPGAPSSEARRVRRASCSAGAADASRTTGQVDALGRSARPAGRGPRRGLAVRRPAPGRGAATGPRCRRRAGSTPSTGTPVASIALHDLVGVPRGAGLVQDHAGARATSRVEGVAARARSRRRRSARRGEMSTTSTTGVRVSGGDVGGRREAVAADLPVEQAHHALDDGDVGGPAASRAAAAARAAPRRRGAGRGCGRAARWPARGSRGRCSRGRPCAPATRVPGAGAARPSARWRRWSCRGRTRGRRSTSRGAGLTTRCPRWPFWPSSIGCLTLVISVTRSATSISAGRRRRPVMTTCWRPGRSVRVCDDVVDVDPAPLHRVGELVQDVEAVGSAASRALDLRPALGGVGGVVVLAAGLARPRPARAHLVPLDRAALAGLARAARPRRLQRGLLADPPLGRLHELEHPDRPALVPARAAPARRRRSTSPCRRRCGPSAAAGCGAAGWSGRRRGRWSG